MLSPSARPLRWSRGQRRSSPETSFVSVGTEEGSSQPWARVACQSLVPALERREFSLWSSDLEFDRTSVDPGLAFGEQPGEEASQNACSGLHGFNASPFGPEVSKTSAQVTLTPEQRWRGQAEGISPALAVVFEGMADDSASPTSRGGARLSPELQCPSVFPGIRSEPTSAWTVMTSIPSIGASTPRMRRGSDSRTV
jgi:hypothetical protein